MQFASARASVADPADGLELVDIVLGHRLQVLNFKSILSFLNKLIFVITQFDSFPEEYILLDLLYEQFIRQRMFEVAYYCKWVYQYHNRLPVNKYKFPKVGLTLLSSVFLYFQRFIFMKEKLAFSIHPPKFV